MKVAQRRSPGSTKLITFFHLQTDGYFARSQRETPLPGKIPPHEKNARQI